MRTNAPDERDWTSSIAQVASGRAGVSGEFIACLGRALMITAPGGSTICAANSQAESLFGCRLKKLIGRPPASLFAGGKSTEEFRRALRRLSERKSVWFGQVDAVGVDGRRFICNVDMASLRAGAKGQFSVGLICRDVTELVSQERCFRKSERWYQGLVEAQNSLVARTDPAGVFLFANSAYCRKFGKRPKELIGTSIFDLLSKDNVAMVRKLYDDIRRPPHRHPPQEWQVHCHDGERWIEFEIVGILDDAGKVTEVQMVGRPTTREHEFLGQLQDALRMNKALLDASQDALFICDCESRILLVNEVQARRMGLSKEQAIGKKILDQSPGELAASRRAVLERILQTRQPVIHEDCRDGRRYMHSACPILDESGRVTMIAVHSRDITDAYDAQKSLEQKNAALKELLDQMQTKTRDVEQSVLQNVNNIVMPFIDSIGKGLSGPALKQMENLKEALSQIVSPFVGRLTDKLHVLTPTEIRLCWHIRQGKSTKEVAQMEHLSPATVNKHRENIRRKLGITNTAANLATSLAQLMGN